MTTIFQPSSEVKAISVRKSRRANWLLFIVVAALAIAYGARRTPANPVEPLVLLGTERLETLENRATIRLGTFNIHSGVGHDRIENLQRISGCIGNLDVVALQEVRGNLLGLRDNQAKIIGDEISMASLFMPNECGQLHHPYGNALLTRVPLLMQQRIPLVSNNDHGYRGALLTQFLFQGRTVNLLSTHIDRGKDHDMQIKAIVDIFLSLAEPSVLMGDLNSDIDHVQMQRLLTAPRVRNALSDYRRNCVRAAPIDWIVTRGFQTVAAKYIEESGSDHPLDCAELSLLAGD